MCEMLNSVLDRTCLISYFSYASVCDRVLLLRPRFTLDIAGIIIRPRHVLVTESGQPQRGHLLSDPCWLPL